MRIDASLIGGRRADVRIAKPEAMPDNPYRQPNAARRADRMAHALLREVGLDAAKPRRSWPRAAPTQGEVVIAEQQTAGRGRMGRTWHSPPGVNLYAPSSCAPQMPVAEAAR